MKRWLPMIILMLLGIMAAYIALTPMQHSVMHPASSTSPKENVLILKMAHNTAEQSALHEASVRFARQIEAKSAGMVRIEIFPAQLLGNDHQMVEMARNGEIDILLTPTAKMGVAVPAMQYADLPFYFPTKADLYAMLDGEPGRMMLEALGEIGLVGITFWENGFKHFTANMPLRTPEDFEGKKFRVMKSRIIMEQFKALGAEAVPIDFYATRTALSDGVVDGQENPLVAIVSMGFHEVQSDLTLSAHAFLGYVFSISAKRFEVLPLELRQMLVETAREVTPWEREETARREAELLEKIRAHGVRIHTLDADQRLRFAALMRDIPKLFEPVVGTHILSKTEELLWHRYGAQECYLIGIDADLSMKTKEAGLAIKRGVELAVEEINAKGGILGRPLCVVARDHRAMDTKGIENLRVFYADPRTIAVVGGLHSAVVMGEMEMIKNSATPYLIPWAAAAELTRQGVNVFRVSADDESAALFLLEEALRRFEHPAVFVENSVWGRGSLERMKSVVQARGGVDLSSFIINRGQQEFANQIDQAYAQQCDGIIMVLNTNEAGLLVESLAQRDQPLAVVSHWGISGGDFYTRHVDALRQLDLRFLQTFHPHQNRTLRSAALLHRYYERYGNVEQIPAVHGVVQAYDLIHLLAKAAERAQSVAPEALRRALESIEQYDGALKHYTYPFSSERHDALGISDYFMAAYERNGTIMPVAE
ncbi:MAG: DctP family TRAP transporter solute-binding subunit [Campylobacterales bacterium]|nr:DctP family TRAP transporter solute-binding subunit [Campylobacterales bacterium]